MSKNKKLKIDIELSDSKTHSHIMYGYGLVSRYRALKNEPQINFATWVANILVTASNEMIRFHNNVLEQQIKKQEEAKTEEVKEKEVTTNDESSEA